MYLLQIATGRGVSSLKARTHEGGARLVSGERYRVPRGFRETCSRATGLWYLRRRAAGCVDGAVVLRGHVLYANQTRVP